MNYLFGTQKKNQPVLEPVPQPHGIRNRTTESAKFSSDQISKGVCETSEELRQKTAQTIDNVEQSTVHVLESAQQSAKMAAENVTEGIRESGQAIDFGLAIVMRGVGMHVSARCPKCKSPSFASPGINVICPSCAVTFHSPTPGQRIADLGAVVKEVTIEPSLGGKPEFGA